ncbi:MAG: DUF2497 domain-containing protein [Caulobacteraceae bacterium]
MPEQTAAEPSMDDILASIRRIISEDEAPAAEAPAVAAASGEGVPAPAEAAPAPPTEDGEAPKGDAPPAPEPEALVGEAAAGAAGSAFETLKVSADEAARARATMDLPAPGRSLEDVTRELLRPLLKTWLDEHLPTIVRTCVEEEVARIARGRVR